MKNTYTPLRGIVITGLILILLSLCLCFGLRFLKPAAVYADGIETVVTEEPAPAEPAENYWVESPDIVRWTYGAFQKTTNIITAKPARGGVTFSIRRHDKSVINAALEDFLVDEHGIVPDAVEAELKKLGVLKDGYILTATATEADEYGRLSGEVEFEIIQATNSWLVYPAVLGWRYGEYDPTINFINAVPAYGAENLTFILYVRQKNGSFIMKKFPGLSGNPYFFKYEEDGTFSNYIISELSALDAGTYSLVAWVGGTENYTGLNTDKPASASTGAMFNVLKTANSWQSAPSIVQWTWNNFISSVNLLTAVPAFPVQAGEKIVRFGIYTDKECGAEAAVAGLEEFYTRNKTADREQVESKVEEKLRLLPAGDYYLLAETEGSTNFTGLRTPVPFTVHKNPNKWKTTPNVVQWSYGSYDPEINLITAVPEYPASGADVRFNVFNDDGATFAFEQPQEGFTVDDETEAQLLNLGVGTYVLKAVAAGSGDYSGLEASISFRVFKIQNYWTSTPSVISWDFGEFDNSYNKISANPAFGSATISIYGEDGEALRFESGNGTVTSFNLVYGDGVPSVPDYVADSLKSLGVGEYYMLATVAGGGENYTGLNDFTDFSEIKAHAVRFMVSPAANGWVTVPKILSWYEGRYDAEKNKIFAEAKMGNDKMHIYLIDNSDERILTSNSGGNKLDYDLISKLPVGSYTVRFEVSATKDYAGLDGEITFAVFEDAIGLSGIKTAVIVFAALDVIAAGVCITLIVIRRMKIEDGYREMIRRELDGR